MTEKLQPGEHVRWNTPQGETSGKVVKKVTATTNVKGKVKSIQERPAIPRSEQQDRRRGGA
ncbi:MAG: HVA1 family protein [Acetobacteraceae bacterium]|nr:HVA1 family protein [Acetobacteraceae bacterium]